MRYNVSTHGRPVGESLTRWACMVWSSRCVSESTPAAIGARQARRYVGCIVEISCAVRYGRSLDGERGGLGTEEDGNSERQVMGRVSFNLTAGRPASRPAWLFGQCTQANRQELDPMTSHRASVVSPRPQTSDRYQNSYRPSTTDKLIKLTIRLLVISGSHSAKQQHY